MGTRRGERTLGSSACFQNKVVKRQEIPDSDPVASSVKPEAAGSSSDLRFPASRPPSDAWSSCRRQQLSSLRPLRQAPAKCFTGQRTQSTGWVLTRPKRQAGAGNTVYSLCLQGPALTTAHHSPEGNASCHLHVTSVPPQRALCHGWMSGSGRVTVLWSLSSWWPRSEKRRGEPSSGRGALPSLGQQGDWVARIPGL